MATTQAGVRVFPRGSADRRTRPSRGAPGPARGVLVLCLAAAPAAASAAPAAFAGEDDAAAVAALVAARCAPCHSPAHPDAASEPRALRKWSGASDLGEVVATAVVPGAPDDSDLYLSVELDEMPPSDSAFAALTADEKALMHRWIVAGAPLPAAATAPPAAAPSDGGPTGPAPAPAGSSGAAAGQEPAGQEQADPEPAVPRGEPEATTPRAPRRESAAPPPLELAGRFHPLAVHFPIALLLAAVPAALLARLRREGPFAAIADYCTALGAAGAVVGAALGWCAHEAGAGALQPRLLERHEWTGFATAGLAVLALVAAWSARRGRPFGRFHLPLLLATAAVVSIAGHYGGMLVYGEDFLPIPFPF